MSTNKCLVNVGIENRDDITVDTRTLIIGFMDEFYGQKTSQNGYWN